MDRECVESRGSRAAPLARHLYLFTPALKRPGPAGLATDPDLTTHIPNKEGPRWLPAF